jgi:hypothetical protein
MVYSRAERVFILEHYFSSKSFAAVYEEFSSAYRVKQQYTDWLEIFGTQEVFVCLREGGGHLL